MTTKPITLPSGHRRLVLQGLGISLGAALTTACGGGGDASEHSSAIPGTSSALPENNAGTTARPLAAVTPVPAPSTGTAQFFAASATGVSNAPFCIGQAFRQGEIPSGSSIHANIAEFQATVKNRWPDGSVKFAILAGRLGVTAGATKTVVISKGTPGSGQPVIEEDQLIAANPNVVVQFGSLGSVRLRDLLGVASTYNSATRRWSAGRVKQWISGPQMSAWLYRSHIGSDAHLVAWFEVRMWKDGAVQVLPWLENGYLQVANPATRSGLAKVTINGTERFSWDFSGAKALPHHCRAPLVGTDGQPHWLGAPPDLSLSHDTLYLQQTRLVPSYFASTPASSAKLADLARAYTPLARLDYAVAISATGYAPSVGLIPEWDALYLTSRGDTRAMQAVVAHGLAAGRFSIHYRDETTGEPIRFSLHPNLVLNSLYPSVTGVGYSTANQYTPKPLNPGGAEWDLSSHPSVGYMAYLLTGWHHFLDAVQFAAGVNFLHHHSGYRQGAKGVFETGRLPTRGPAWGWRTLAQAASITPDDHVLRGEYVASLDHNMDHYHRLYVASPSCPLGICRPYRDYTVGTDGRDNDGVYTHAVWMGDILTAAAGYAYAADVSGSTALRAKHRDFFAWKARSVVGRLAASNDSAGWPFVDAARPFHAIAPAHAKWESGTGPWYANWRQAYEAHLRVAASTDPIKEAPGNALRGSGFPDVTGYWGDLLPAIAYAVDLGAAGAAAAYARLTGASNWNQLLTSGNEVAARAIRPAGADGTPPPTSGSDDATMPAWRRGQALNTWREIPGSSMSLLPAPPSDLRALSYGDSDSKINAWNSLALDRRDATLYCAANGGHTDYAGNEVNSIRLLDDAPRWIERVPPTSAAQVVADAAYYADGRPSSRHSYYGHIFVEQRNRAMHLYNGVPYGNGRGGGWVVDGFDPATNRWDARDTYPTAAITELALGSPMALDPTTGDVYAFPCNGYSVWRWNQQSNTWSGLVGGIPEFNSYYAASAFDTRRRRVLLLGGYVSQYKGRDKGVLFDVATNSMSNVTFTGSAAAALSAMPGLTGSVGLVYVPELDAYVVGGDTSSTGGVSVFLINASTLTVSGVNTGTAGNGILSCNSNIFNRFLWVPKLGGIVYYPVYKSNLWFLRLI